MKIDLDSSSFEEIERQIHKTVNEIKAKAAEELAMKRPPDSVQRQWLLEEAQKYREG